MNEARDQAIRDEKRRLSQNLHDDLSGLLASVHNRINLLSLDTSSDAAMENIKQMKILIQKSYQQVRFRSHELRDTSLIIDGQRFARHIEDLTKAAFPNQQYTFTVNIDDGALNDSSFELRENIIRILQETFTNIIKHARADHVDLLLYRDGESFMLDIQDNGQGFKKSSKKNGIGLKNMKDRARHLGGKMEISSNTNGTLFKFSFPVESE